MISSRTLLGAALSLLFATVSGRVMAHANGMGTGGCVSCHIGGKAANVMITASPAVFGPGEMTTLTIAVSQTNGPSAGFYLNANGVGTFSIVDSGTKLMGLGVTHSTPRVGTGGSTTFRVAWTAPNTPGGVGFSVWANSANADGRANGDGEGLGYLSTAFGCIGTKYYRDADGDGVGAESSGYLVACALPQNYSATGTDCNDNDQHVYPGAAEVCDDKDNNCDGQSDENLQPSSYCTDADGDGHGVSGQKTMTGCAPAFGFGLCDNDCNDADPRVYPSAAEVCNGRDDNCNNRIDENARAACGVGWCARLATSCQSQCTPGQPIAETCNDFDDDCDGVADNGSDLQLCGQAGLICRMGECLTAGDASAEGGRSAMAAGGAPVAAGGRPAGDASAASGGGSAPPSGEVRPAPSASGASCSLGLGSSGTLGYSAVALVCALLSAYRRKRFDGADAERRALRGRRSAQ